MVEFMRIQDVRVLTISCPALDLGEEWGEFWCCSPTRLYEAPHSSNPSMVTAKLIEVSTDTGIRGYGEAGDSGMGPRIVTNLKPLVIGEDPYDVERLWDKMLRGSIRYGRKGGAIEAISGIEIALWDILGKDLSKPVYQLIGGRTKERIRVYASALYARKPGELKKLAAEAERYLEEGFTAMKQRFGYGPGDGVKGAERNVELVKNVRDVVGYDVELMADAFMGWNLQYALKMVGKLERYELNWLEEPFMPDDVESYVRLSASTTIPISAGEDEYTRYGFKDLIEKRAVAIVQPDCTRVGGISEAKKVAAIASLYGIPCIPHIYGGVVGLAANLSLIASTLNCPIAEYNTLPNPLRDNLVAHPIKAVKGYIEPLSTPGIGVELDGKMVERYLVKDEIG